MLERIAYAIAEVQPARVMSTDILRRALFPCRVIRLV
jgi:hypothetical protein